MFRKQKTGQEFYDTVMGHYQGIQASGYPLLKAPCIPGHGPFQFPLSLNRERPFRRKDVICSSLSVFSNHRATK